MLSIEVEHFSDNNPKKAQKEIFENKGNNFVDLLTISRQRERDSKA